MEKCCFMSRKQKTIFEWKIGDFPLIMKHTMENHNPYTILSSEFPTADWKSKWQLVLNFNNGNKSEDKEWISIYLNSKSISYTKIFRVKYSLFIFNDKKEKKCEQKSYKVFEEMEYFCVQKFLKIKQLLEKKDKLLPDNTLTIGIKLTEFIESSCLYSPIIKIPVKTSDRQIVHDLKDLFDSKAGSDVVLVVGDKKIPAHKTLLMSRSPVFSAMFTHPLEENRENEVTIPDMDPDVCEKLLEFIYTDNVTNLDKVAGRLFEVADKYQIPALKESCEELFCKNVNVKNAVQYLVLLDSHNGDERFFKYIIDFIAINFKKIFETSEYKALEKTNPELSLTIVKEIRSNR
ncbi:speckle-type POZ protein-like [Microplitis mediator]|uniref:speckle-type POZ protein-like n=1 Tax=Microplitis mediator TaxID=375433 RepID=UPI0025543CB7|nr:speckle-type POZ protein-like [Microplitis mediator]